MPDSRGFTIVEVLVALLVLVVGLVGTLAAFVSAARTFEDGHSSIVASARAAEVLESVRALKCRGSAAGAGGDSTVSYFWRTDEISSDLRRATVVVRIAGVRNRADTFSAMLPC